VRGRERGGVGVEMVTLLMRSPELAVGERLSMASLEHEQEKVVSQKPSSEVRTRARKGRNAQKKQPQRGLGVAQLEKLRLQEQSKLEAACFASWQGPPPSFGFADQNGICFRPMKSGTMSHQPSALSYCNGRSEKLSHYLSGDPRQLGKDGDMFRTIISLANSDHSTAGSFARHGHEGVALMLPRSRERMEQSYGCTSMRTVPSLASLSERPGSKGQGSCGTYAEESSGKQLMVACLGSPSSPTAKSSLFSNTLTTGVNLVDSLASNVEQVEQQRLSEAGRESVHKFQVPSNGVGDAAGVRDTKLLPAAAKYGAGSLFV